MPEKLTKTNREYLSLIPIVIISMILLSLCIQEGHNWSGDYALYIEQTQAILSGTINKLYTLSKYSNDHAYRVQGAYLYPMGFPILMILPYSVFGMNFIVLKIFCSIFFLGALPLCYILFRRYFSNILYPLCIVIALAFHHEFIVFSDFVYSDFPFLFFSMLTFLCMRSKNIISNQLWLGGLIFFSYYIRDVGIAFLPALLVYQLQVKRYEEPERQKRYYFLIPYLLFAFFYLLNYMFLPKGTANHYAHLWSNLSWALIIKNSLFYLDLISSYFFVTKWIFLFLFIPFLIGVYSVRKEQLHFLTFILFVLCLYLLWPAWQGMRFIFPILPFLLYFIVQGFVQIALMLRLPQRYPIALLIGGLCAMSYLSLQRIIDFSKTNSNLAYNEDTKKMYAYIIGNIPENEIIGFEKPRPLRLFTGRNSILSDLKHFEHTGVSYLLIRVADLSTGSRISYRKVYETRSLILVHR